jgi:hypothetical protein
MIVTEEEQGWDLALKVDLEVWVKMLKIIIRRLKAYLNLKTNNLRDLIEILTFRWSIEGWDYETINFTENAVDIKVHKCPYKSVMDRNPERQNKIPLICKDMCIPFYQQVIKDYNPEIDISRIKYMGLGDNICDFHLEDKNSISIKSKTIQKNISKRDISIDDKLFYFEKNFKTLDGLWIIELERLTNWQIALKIDIIVWQRLYEIIFRRVKQYLNIKGNSIEDLVELLSFIWSCEGYEYKVVKKINEEAILHMTTCPYIDSMRRNPDRHDKIESICKDMCIPFYEPALKEFNPKIKLERREFIGLGNKICDYHFILE